MHVHVGIVEAVVTAAYLIIFGFLWRSATIALAETPLGQAMAYIYG